MRFSRPTLIIGAFALLAAMGGCTTGGTTPSPTAPSTTPSTPATSATPPVTTSTPVLTVTRISITPIDPLRTVGQTTQLVATATLSDGTTKDVSAEGRWTSSDIRVVTISATGLLTVAGFGSTTVGFSYQTRGAGLTVTATPVGTFVISGRVREPGASGVPNVTVVETILGRSATTDTNGLFSLANLPSLQTHLKVAKDGYEPMEIDAAQPSVDLPIQHVVRVTAGEIIKPAPLAPNDLAYTVDGNRCTDCRLIRVVSTQAGTVHIHVTWIVNGPKLTLFAEGQVVEGTGGTLTADVPLNAPREIVMYLGTVLPSSVQSHTAFTFETSMR